MSASAKDGEDHGEVFLDEDDIIEEINIDEEDLPDADDDDGEALDEADDSMYIFPCHNGELYTVACSPTHANLVATGAGDDKGFLWKIDQRGWAFELQGHNDSISSVAFSSDGQLVASGSFDGLVQVWDVSGNLKCKFDDGFGAGVEWIRWHPREHLVLAGLEDSTVWMWNADRSAYLKTFSGHASTVTCGDFTPNGQNICTGSDDASLRIWNPRTGESIRVSLRGKAKLKNAETSQGLTCLTISSDSTHAFTGTNDGSVYIVKIATGKVVNSLTSHSDSIECIGLSASSPCWAATGSMDQKLIIWDLKCSLARCTCEHEGGVTCLSWLGASRFVATGCVDGRVRIWDSLSGDCVETFRGHTDVIQSLAVSADGRHLVSVSLDGTARVFKIDEFR